jgi:hypothetical protein
MLIYIGSLTPLQSVMNVIIDYQYPNIELTSPMHFIEDVTYYGHFPQQVNSKSEVKVNFKIGVHQSTLGGALLYHIQRKENGEYNNRADEDTAISTQLLVIWKFRIDRLYSYVYLIEHESTLVWNEEMLKMLYDVYNSQVDTEFIFDSGKWLLDNNTMLQITCKALYERSFEIYITISEKKDLLHPTKPLWVDSNR